MQLTTKTNFTALEFEDEHLTILYFSYNTCVAFQYDHALYCSENAWGTATAKHLNLIQPDEKQRMNISEFKKKLSLLYVTMEKDYEPTKETPTCLHSY